MATPEQILDRLLLVGGPPRSGTTFAARALNGHPRIVTAVDDHVCECWALYYYPTRLGLVQELRAGTVTRERALERLRVHLFDGGRFAGLLPSTARRGLPVAASLRAGASPAENAARVARISLSLEHFGDDGYLCLKSPEITFVLRELAGLFDTARFVLVHRPVAEIAESMFRKGLTVRRVAVYHRRWEKERDANGEWIPPPGVLPEWTELWNHAGSFQRCVLYAASYLRAMAEGCERLPADCCFTYDHARLRENSGPILSALAAFLGVDSSGFAAVPAAIRQEVPCLPAELIAECEALREELEIDALECRIRKLDERSLSPAAATKWQP